MTSPQDHITLNEHEEAAANWCMIFGERPLTVDEQIQFEQWVDADAGNAARFERMVAVWQLTDAIAEMPSFLTLRAKALAAMDDAQAVQPPAKRGMGRRGFAMAASVALLGLIGAWNWMTGPDVYTTAVGERRTILLADGSMVSMDAASQISVNFKDERRSIVLNSGRAKFDVAKDPMRPFTVQAGSQAVVAIGTSFSVELLQEQLRVLLFEGKVSVLPRDYDGAKSWTSLKAVDKAVSLSPGQELVATPASGAGKIVQADVEKAASWEDGRLDFVDMPLSKAVDRFNRYSPIPIVIEDAAAGRTLINGVFDSGDAASFVAGVTSLYNLDSRSSDEKIVVKSTR